MAPRTYSGMETYPNRLLTYTKDLSSIEAGLLQSSGMESLGIAEKLLLPLNSIHIDKSNTNPPKIITYNKGVLIRHEKYIATLHNIYLVNGYILNGLPKLQTRILFKQEILDDEDVRIVSSLIDSVESFYNIKPEITMFDIAKKNQLENDIITLLKQFPILADVFKKNEEHPQSHPI